MMVGSLKQSAKEVEFNVWYISKGVLPDHGKFSYSTHHTLKHWMKVVDFMLL